MASFDNVWNQSLHDGLLVSHATPAMPVAFAGDLGAAGAAAKKAAAGAGEWELSLYTTEAVGDGQHANNPWLQEMPDPLTKIT